MAATGMEISLQIAAASRVCMFGPKLERMCVSAARSFLIKESLSLLFGALVIL
jgi:hypothetical protein